jgi:hypothetical protein
LTRPASPACAPRCPNCPTPGAAVRQRLRLPDYDAGVLTQASDLADFFEATAAACGNAKAASNWIMGELLRTLKDRGVALSAIPLTPADSPGSSASSIRHHQQLDRQGRVRQDARSWRVGRRHRHP